MIIGSSQSQYTENWLYISCKVNETKKGLWFSMIVFG